MAKARVREAGMRHLNTPALEFSKALPFLRLASAVPALLPVETVPDRQEISITLPALGSTPQHLQLNRPAVLAHDIRNALTSLELLSSLLGEPGVIDASNEQFALDLKQVSSLLKNLFEQFVAEPAEAMPDDAEPMTGPTVLPARKRSASANEALVCCTRLLRTVAGAGREVHISAESNLPPLALSDDLLLRVLMNLVKNSSEAIAEAGLVRGVIRITGRRALSAQQPAVLVHVSDNGPGIPSHALASVFQPGFTSKRKGPHSTASGLGLAIVRSLIEGVGGQVLVASTRRRGTTFELRIPCL